MNDALRATAYHEAGHAIAAIALGMRFEGLTVAADARTYGGIQLRLPPHPSLEDDDNTAVIASAGPHAERRYRASAGLPERDDESKRGWLIDEQDIADVAARRGLTGEEATTYVDDVERRGKTLIDEHWEDVERIASYLEQHPSAALGTEDVQHLLAGEPTTGDDLGEEAR